MTEASSVELPKVTVSRRNILKITAGAIAAKSLKAIVGNELSHEQQLSEKGSFETKDAVWYPIYERHDQHDQTLVPKNIPPTLQALSMEGILTDFTFGADGKEIEHNSLQSPPDSLLASKQTGYDTTPPSTFLEFPIETLSYLKAKNIPVAFGDVKYEEDLLTGSQSELALDIQQKIGKTFLEAGLLTALGGALKTAKIDRRGLLRLGGAAVATAGASMYLPAHFKPEIQKKVMEAIQNNSPQERLWSRIMSMSTDMTPGDLNGLFRELLQAKKLITLAKSMNAEQPNKKAEIGYSWHLGHRGIEDWLRLGEDVVRACILAYPDEVLKKIVEVNNNDPRVLYAIRLIHIPQSFKILSADDGVTWTFDEKEPILDRIIGDEKLAESLKQRGIV